MKETHLESVHECNENTSSENHIFAVKKRANKEHVVTNGTLDVEPTRLVLRKNNSAMKSTRSIACAVHANVWKSQCKYRVAEELACVPCEWR